MYTPFSDRQYDITRNRDGWLTVPHYIPGRLNATDFVFFNYSREFPVCNYRVVVEAPSNASPFNSDRYRDIGPLEKKVELPDVIFQQGFGSHAKILVLPYDIRQPAFMGNLVRGSTYTLDPHARCVSVEGHIGMQRTGVY